MPTGKCSIEGDIDDIDKLLCAGVDPQSVIDAACRLARRPYANNRRAAQIVKVALPTPADPREATPDISMPVQHIAEVAIWRDGSTLRTEIVSFPG